MRQRKYALLAVLLSLAACTSTLPPDRIALNTLQSIRVSVEASLKVFNAGYQAGTFTELQRTQLQNLYVKYLAADTVAARAIQVATSPDYTAAISSVTVLAGDVIKFVQTLKGGP